MASLSAKKTNQSLLKKGFKEAPGDHHWFEFHYNGNFITKTKTSRGTGEIHTGLISAMSKQCRMSAPFFKEFAICTKSQADYIALLKDNGIIVEDN